MIGQFYAWCDVLVVRCNKGFTLHFTVKSVMKAEEDPPFVSLSRDCLVRVVHYFLQLEIRLNSRYYLLDVCSLVLYRLTLESEVVFTL